MKQICCQRPQSHHWGRCIEAMTALGSAKQLIEGPAWLARQALGKIGLVDQKSVFGYSCCCLSGGHEKLNIHHGWVLRCHVCTLRKQISCLPSLFPLHQNFRSPFKCRCWAHAVYWVLKFGASLFSPNARVLDSKRLFWSSFLLLWRKLLDLARWGGIKCRRRAQGILRTGSQYRGQGNDVCCGSEVSIPASSAW